MSISFTPRKPDYYNIPISSVCNAKCFFCSNDANPFEIKRVGFRDISEIKKQIDDTEYINGVIFLGGTVSGRYGDIYSGKTEGIISYGEPLLHPQFFEILSLIRNKFQNRICIITNGSLLTEEFIGKLSEYSPIDITLSISSINKEMWMKLYNMPESKYDIVINSFDTLTNNNISCTPSIVPMPEFIGYEDIENTLDFFAQKNLKHVTIFSPGYTKYSDSEVVNKMQFDEDELYTFLLSMKEKYNMMFRWTMNPYLPLDIDNRTILNKLKELNDNNIKTAYWFTSTAAYTRFEELVSSLNKFQTTENIIVPVENKSFGGNVSCAGLWLFRDILEKIEELNLENEYIILPGTFLDKNGYDLSGVCISDMENIIGNSISIIN